MGHTFAMPWQELSPVNLRMRFVTDWQRDCWTMTELCADYQISRKTGYKWVDRYETAGPPGVQDRARRAAHSPCAPAPHPVAAPPGPRARPPRGGGQKIFSG